MNGMDTVNNFKKILGKHTNERISCFIVNLVVESQSGNATFERIDSDKSSVSDDEEYKEESENTQVSIILFKPIFNYRFYLSITSINILSNSVCSNSIVIP